MPRDVPVLMPLGGALPSGGGTPSAGAVVSVAISIEGEGSPRPVPGGAVGVGA